MLLLCKFCLFDVQPSESQQVHPWSQNIVEFQPIPIVCAAFLLEEDPLLLTCEDVLSRANFLQDPIKKPHFLFVGQHSAEQMGKVMSGALTQFNNTARKQLLLS